MGICRETNSHVKGNTRPQSSQLAKPLWTDPGPKRGISLRELISTLKKKKKKRRRGTNCRTFSQNLRTRGNPPPKPPPPPDENITNNNKNDIKPFQNPRLRTSNNAINQNKTSFFLIWTVQERGPQRGMWVPRATPATSAPTRRLTVTPPTPTTRCASAKPAGWPKGPSVVSGGVRCM